MKPLLLNFLCLMLTSISLGQTSEAASREKIDQLLNAWHEAAANAAHEDYFEKMAEPSIFIGTDPTENWTKSEFKIWSKPYFDRGKAWSFTPLERNIFLAENEALGWFDELLETQMGICRGSGVVIKEGDQWKVKHYVLSIAIPNDQVDRVTELKSAFDQSLISELKSK